MLGSLRATTWAFLAAFFHAGKCFCLAINPEPMMPTLMQFKRFILN